MLEPTVQAAPVPHFPHTEFRQGGQVWSVCGCGTEQVASSHAHSVQLGREHLLEVFG